MDVSGGAIQGEGTYNGRALSKEVPCAEMVEVRWLRHKERRGEGTKDGWVWRTVHLVWAGKNVTGRGWEVGAYHSPGWLYGLTGAPWMLFRTDPRKQEQKW